MKYLIQLYHRIRCHFGFHAKASYYTTLTYDGAVKNCSCPWCGYKEIRF